MKVDMTSFAASTTIISEIFRDNYTLILVEPGVTAMILGF